MSLSKSKYWYSNNCLHSLKHSVPLYVDATVEISQEWPMGGKAKSRCCLGMLKVNKLRHS
jgi:hypothetical protein